MTMILDGTNGATFPDTSTQAKAGLVAGGTIATGTVTTLTSTTLSDGTNSTSSTNCIQGSAKAWVNFNGVSGAVARASYNISSLTRASAGTYTINFTNALSDANYCVVVGSSPTTAPNASIQPQLFSQTSWAISAPSSSSFGILTPGSNFTLYDNQYICLAVFR